MKLLVNDYEKWYIAQSFGNKTTYGFHEGIDLNLKTGGDTDLGQPLLAIANGEVTSVHEHTTKPTFGKHIHILHKGPWGEVYSHYAHCQEIYLKVGDKVTEGQVIATVGKSGTDFAHCHFSLKLQPTGIDAIAKTEEDLKKWTDPIPFIQKWNIQQDNMPEWLKTLLQERNLTIENEPEIRSLFDKAKRYDDEISQLKEQVISANEALADRAREVSMLTEANQKLSNRVTEAEELFNTTKGERDQATWEVTKLEVRIKMLDEEIVRLSEEIDNFKEANDILAYGWLTRLFSLFRTR